MSVNTFKGGKHIHDFKELTNSKPVNFGFVPKIVTIPLSQHSGAPATCLVSKNDLVKVGQKIGEASAFISANVHSSVSGKVKSIDEIMTATGVMCQGVTIENDGLDELGYEEKNLTIDEVSATDIIDAIKEAGIVGLGGAGFPTHVKLTAREGQITDYIIINCAECEPYLTSDQLMMELYPEKVVMGLLLAMKAMGAKKGILGIEDNKPLAIDKLKEASKSYPEVTVSVVKTKYPQGDQKRLIQATTGIVVPSGASTSAVGIRVINANTAIAIKDAVLHGKPLYEKLVTMTGHALKEPQNVMVRVGSKVSDIVEFIGGYSSEPGKIISGGPMMGETQYTPNVTTGKAMGGLLFMTQEESAPKAVSPCIRCGRCVDICPVYLQPLYLQLYTLKNRVGEAEKLHLMDCIECGSCSYICPSNRPLVETIRLGKAEVRKQGKGKRE